MIPVAGFGTRFLPATKSMPKEMLTLVDRPVIQYIVEEFVAAGITEIILVTSSDKRAIEDHFDRSFELEYHLERAGKKDALKEVRRIANLARFIYVRQQEMRGNGHALLQAREALGDEPFALAWGDDIILPDGNKPAGIADLLHVYRKTGSSVIGVSEVPFDRVKEYGVVRPVGRARDRSFRISQVVEKPVPERAPSRYAISGRYVFTPDLWPVLERVKPTKGGEIWIATAIDHLIRTKPVYASVMHGRYLDCGSKLGFMEAIVRVGLEHREFSGPFRRFLSEVTK